MFRRLSYRFIGLVCICLATNVAIYQAHGQTRETSPDKLLVLGDSISAGYGIPAGKNWVDLLQIQLNSGPKSFKLVNASISGETSAGGLSRITELLTKNQPKILILELGANDGLRGFGMDQTQMNLQKIIDLAKKNQAKVLLVGMKIPTNYGLKYTQQFEEMFQHLAKKNQLNFVPFLLEKIVLKKEYFQEDGIHPNEGAQRLMMQTVQEKLMPMLK